MSIGTSDGIQLFTVTASFGALANAPVSLDTRMPGVPAAQVRTLTDATTPGNNWFSVFMTSNVPYNYDTPVVLGPGTGLYVTTLTAVELIRCSFLWTERNMVAEELAET